MVLIAAEKIVTDYLRAHTAKSCAGTKRQVLKTLLKVHDAELEERDRL